MTETNWLSPVPEAVRQEIKQQVQAYLDAWPGAAKSWLLDHAVDITLGQVVIELRRQAREHEALSEKLPECPVKG